MSRHWILLSKVFDFFFETFSAQRTLRFDLQPFSAALRVEIVFGIAVENQYFVIGLEVYEANRTVSHTRILILVLSVAHVLQRL